MNDNTRIRIAVPARLYESVKKQLTLKEGKQNFGSGMTTVKEKKMAEPKVEGMKSSKTAKMETEKTLEERIAALEEMLNKAMKNSKKKTEEGMEDEIGYEAGEQHPDDKPGVPKSLAGGEETSVEKSVKEGESGGTDPKIEKFMNDNTSFIDKIKMTVSNNPKLLASLMSTISKKVSTDKKIVSTSDTKKAGEYLDKAAGNKPAASPVKK